MPAISGLVISAVNGYWRSGVVSALLIADGLSLFVCGIDTVRCYSSGGSLIDVWNVTWEKAKGGEGVWIAFCVVILFVVGLPMLVQLLSIVVGPIDRWPSPLNKSDSRVLVAHVCLSALLGVFTMLAISMEVLSGYENNGEVKYTFLSTWLGVVFLGKPLWVSYISPILRKFLIRFSRHQGRKTFKEAGIETLTEESLGSGEHTA